MVESQTLPWAGVIGLEEDVGKKDDVIITRGGE